MIHEFVGNLFESPGQIRCHQVNCQGVMGAGIAVEAKRRYPEMFQEYKTICKLFGSKNLGCVHFYVSENGTVLANCFSQDGFGRSGIQTNYEKMDECFAHVAGFAKHYGLTVGIPYLMGCGLAGGDWETVRTLIEKRFGASDQPECYICRLDSETVSPKSKKTESHAPVSMKSVKIYTDGACSGNPGPGGWGVVLMCGTGKKELSGSDAETTNNRMEMTAVIEALKALKYPCKVDLYSDSKYVLDSLEKGWAKKWRANGWMRSNNKPAINPDLWEQLLNLTEQHSMTYHWVKGHNNNPYNERCDQLAVSAYQHFLG